MFYFIKNVKTIQDVFPTKLVLTKIELKEAQRRRKIYLYQGGGYKKKVSGMQMKENMKELEVMCHVFLLSFLYDLDIKFSHVNSLPTWQDITHNVYVVGM